MSEPQFHADRLQMLIDLSSNDTETLEFIHDCIQSFSKYHTAIVEMELWLKLYHYDNTEKRAYQNQRVSLDGDRTAQHNAVISYVGALNRMSAAAGLKPIYDGVVSEERPYRRQIANGVLAYIEQLVHDRM